jgi:hypothetical protein
VFGFRKAVKGLPFRCDTYCRGRSTPGLWVAAALGARVIHRPSPSTP